MGGREATLTLVFKEVELHSQEAHGFAEGVGSRALFLRAQLQDLGTKMEAE